MKENNVLQCNLKSGICEMPINNSSLTDSSSAKTNQKPVKIIYYTDPICSSCWVIEPQLRKLKLEYGDNIEIEYRMGGLLPNWNYNSGGISKPSDVAHHWDEVSVYYDMPIEGDVWLEDPLSSSYPPSIAFKAAQIQDNARAILFLREIREMVFLQKKNITKWEHLELAAKKVGLDVVNFKQDYNGKAKELFEEDLRLGRELGVRGFPTMFFTDTTGHKEIVYGSKPYNTFEGTLLKLYPTATKTAYNKTWSSVFSKYHSLTAKEFSELTETPHKECEKYLDGLTNSGKLEKMTTKNGAIWTLKETSR
ncbi:ClpXP adapter SpxH family protein [Mangrovimonas aestuarii]|uniref:ClpXP adapter SpxH family protein n=1 Tax=Mangrovimonas aestuarii TaxID=3018443 RepID=UPI00237907B4|nr:ClpXP adapter SpxH family protein [Mangrovimonas aestuarii]